ncbi:MAG TPA: heat-shock protein Hsp20 [Chloroflexi bacterium]|nr:heat-shock protein Hsp20 [Chloroflexota bacterium]
MTGNNKSLEVQKEEMLPRDGSERTRESRCFAPRADIYEVDEDIFVVVDLPGVQKDAVDISLEKNILKINGYVNPETFEGYALAFAEYVVGDYERSFRLSNQIDQDKIEALLKDGVLKLRLPKAEAAKSRKIAIKNG